LFAAYLLHIKEFLTHKLLTTYSGLFSLKPKCADVILSLKIAQHCTLHFCRHYRNKLDGT